MKIDSGAEAAAGRGSVAFVFAGGRGARLADVLAGRAPTEFFYGAVELARAGFDVHIFDAPDPGRSVFAMVCDLIPRGLRPVRVRGAQLVSTGRLLGVLARFDVVVGTATSHALALGVWKRLGRLPGRLVGIHCGLVNFPTEGMPRRLTATILRDQHSVLFADSERAEMLRRFELASAAVHANPFGVDTSFWTPDSTSDGDYVLAVGNDARRDYATLIAAVRGMSFPVKILTARALPRPLPDNVEHIAGTWHRPAMTDAELRDLYRGARVVVVPLEDAIQPAGQSVAMQAMACGRPVILSRTRGLWTDGIFEDGRDLLLVPAGDPEALRVAIDRCVNDGDLRAQFGTAAVAAVAANAAIGDFADRLRAVIETTGPLPRPVTSD